MSTFATRSCTVLLLSLAFLPSQQADAGFFRFNYAPGGGTFTYNTLRVDPGPSFPENPSPYADFNGVEYVRELPPGGNPFAYYHRNDAGSPLPVSPTFAITLHAALGETFISGTATSRLTIGTYGSAVSGGRVDVTLTTDVAPAPVTLTTLVGQPGHVLDESYAPVSLAIAGSTAFTLTFAISGRADGDVRLFEEFYNESPAMPFVVTATSSVPEPSALAVVVALGAFVAVASRRRRLRRA
jgi:hypothetical protein